MITLHSRQNLIYLQWILLYSDTRVNLLEIYIYPYSLLHLYPQILNKLVLFRNLLGIRIIQIEKVHYHLDPSKKKLQ